VADERLEVTVAELLAEETADELAARDAEWGSFASSVLRRIEVERIEVEGSELAEQAIAALKQEVDAELSDVAPRFEEAFRESVERKIFRAAIEPTFAERMRAWIADLRPGYRLGWAAAAAAVGALVLSVAPFDRRTGSLEAPRAGHVSVARISFEGDVTVQPDDGVTVIWLDAETG
jgi:hypothetical protein